MTKWQIAGTGCMISTLVMAVVVSVGAQYPQQGSIPAIPGVAGMVGAPGAPPQVARMMQSMTLTEAKMDAFLSAVEELQSASKSWKAGDPAKPQIFAQGIGASTEALSILKKHGFADLVGFQQVGYNAAMALGVLRNGGKAVMQKKVAEARSRQAQVMQQMRQKMNPEQMKMLQGYMGTGTAMMNTMREMPDENLDVVEKYRDRMERLGGK